MDKPFIVITSSRQNLTIKPRITAAIRVRTLRCFFLIGDFVDKNNSNSIESTGKKNSRIPKYSKKYFWYLKSISYSY